MPSDNPFFQNLDNSRVVPLDRLVPREPADPDRVIRALDLMRQAAAGLRKKRAPLTVIPIGNGLFRILDGNATYHALRQIGATEAAVSCILTRCRPLISGGALTMENDDAAYRALQQHLDNLPVGFPATRSHSEIRLLQHIFSPLEARVASCMSHTPETPETILDRAGDWVRSLDELNGILENILLKGGILADWKEGKKHYFNVPLVVGIYELQVNRLTPDFVRDFNRYARSREFGVELLSTRIPQMRTIPVEKSITPTHHVADFDEAASLIQLSEPPFVILECICRKKKSIEGKTCRVTDRKETCLAMGTMARTASEIRIGREIDKDEALRILKQNQKDGLVLQPSNTEKADFICSCCGCCCGMLNIQKSLPRPLDFWTSNFFAQTEESLCIGCGICEKRCQVGAVHVSPETRKAHVDRNRCIGCGVCVPTCPEKAVSLVRKPVEVRPPKTREELYEIILSGKKGKLGKWKLQGKLVKDALQTGHIHPVKKKGKAQPPQS